MDRLGDGEIRRFAALPANRPDPEQTRPSVGPNRGAWRRPAGLVALLAALLAPLPGVAAPDTASGSNVNAIETRNPLPLGEGPSSTSSGPDVRLVDAPLLDQDGHPVKFASDAVGDRIVAINFVYTGCTTLCPLTSATFKKVQTLLKAKSDAEVRLISLSLDPETDTPARLKDYAARHHAAPGWLWLTGSRAGMEQVLKGLGAYTAEFRDHPPQVLVGDGRSGRWTRFNSLPAPDRIRQELERYQGERRHD